GARDGRRRGGRDRRGRTVGHHQRGRGPPRRRDPAGAAVGGGHRGRPPAGGGVGRHLQTFGGRSGADRRRPHRQRRQRTPLSPPGPVGGEAPGRVGGHAHGGTAEDPAPTSRPL